MQPDRRRVDGALYMLALALAFALKRHYSLASAEDLAWILGPTVEAVKTVTGASFVAEAGSGYLSRELYLLIAPSCAGVNFLIAAFCTGVFGLLPLTESAVGRALLVPCTAMAAYTLTVAVNTLRILVTIWGRALPTGGGWITADQLHRIEGVTLYFLALCVSFLVARWALLSRRSVSTSA